MNNERFYNTFGGALSGGLAGGTTGGLWGGIAGGAIGGISGALQPTQMSMSNYALKNNLKMLDAQSRAALGLWNATNFEATKQHLMNAGLNPALFYGMGGSGGQLATPQGGNEHIQASKAHETKMANLQSVHAAKEIALLDAQKRNIDADTENKQAQSKTFEAQVTQILADANLKDSQAIGQEISNYINENIKDYSVTTFKFRMVELSELLYKMKRENKMGDEIFNKLIKKLDAEIDNIIEDTNLKIEMQNKVVAEIYSIEEHTKIDWFRALNDASYQKNALNIMLQQVEVEEDRAKYQWAYLDVMEKLENKKISSNEKIANRQIRAEFINTLLRGMFSLGAAAIGKEGAIGAAAIRAIK